LQFDEQGQPLPNTSASLQPKGMLRVDNDFWDLIHYLDGHGYQLGKSLFVFPYDWRWPVQRNAEFLRSRIQELAGTQKKVNLVCHSTGGLLAKAALLDPGYRR
jgi:triacylglycerol esterase/lipase EstA (alpha/beta hydrolase family)